MADTFLRNQTNLTGPQRLTGGGTVAGLLTNMTVFIKLPAGVAGAYQGVITMAKSLEKQSAGALLDRATVLLLASTVMTAMAGGSAIAQDGTPTTLQQITVEGASYETDDSDSYTTDLISVGEKDVRPVREIPQSTTVLTRERLDDGGYTYTQSEYLNTAAAGDVFSTYTPEHMFQLWTKYTFDETAGILDGAFIGGGVTAFSSFSSVGRGVTIEAPGYVTVDLLAGYQINDHLKATLAINNIFDEKYYARVGSNSVFNFYGEPRNANFRLTATF